MRTIGIDTEYDYCSPFLATTTDDDLISRVYRLNVISQRKQIKLVCENPNLIKVFHHASGDIFQFRCIGIKVVGPIEDTLIQSNIIDENYSSRALKQLARVHLHEDTHESNLLRSKIKQYKTKAKKEGRKFKWSDIPEEVIIPYAKRDPEYTIKLHYFWKKPIQQYEKLYEFEKSLIPIIVDMEWKGFGVDRYLCGRRSREYGRKMEVLYEDMAKFIADKKIELPREFKPRSPKQIQQIILALGLGNEVDSNEKTGMPVTDKKQLVKLLHHYDFFKMMMKFRFFSKHKGTYYQPLEEYYTSEKSNRAHCMIYQTGAKTGRFSVELAQTFPRPEDSVIAGERHEVRNAIIPAKGKAFLSKDYEQQEMRLFIHYSNCQRMIDLINSKGGGRGLDIYTETGYLLFGAKFDDPKLRKALRYVTKRNALGGIYSIGVNKLISTTMIELMEKFDREVIEKLGVSQQWAYNVLQEFYKVYPVREYTQRKISELYKKGFIDLEFNSSLMQFSRQYRIPQDKAYKSGNAEIQGTAAYVIKHAMKRVNARLEREGWKGKRVDMILQIHDELLFEVDDDIGFIKYVDNVLTEEMEDWVTFKVPITCSGKWSNKSWGEVVDLK